MRIRATEASRGFSALLTRVAAGETVEVDRHGEVVAVVVPPRSALMSGSALLDLVEHMPLPDPGFADDVRSLSSITASPAEPWQS